MTIKDSKYVKIYSVNLLYFIFGKINGYFEEINGNKCLMLVPTKESKVKIKKIWRTMDENQRFYWTNNFKTQMVMMKNIYKLNYKNIKTYKNLIQI